MTSAGSRSGVNCSRRKPSPSAWAKQRAVSVLPSPGRSSSSTWPPARMPARTSASASRLPTMTVPTASSTRAGQLADLGRRSRRPSTPCCSRGDPLRRRWSDRGSQRLQPRRRTRVRRRYRSGGRASSATARSPSSSPGPGRVARPGEPWRWRSRSSASSPSRREHGGANRCRLVSPSPAAGPAADRVEHAVVGRPATGRSAGSAAPRTKSPVRATGARRWPRQPGGPAPRRRSPRPAARTAEPG